MSNDNPKFGDFITAMFKLIWAPLIIFMLLILMVNCQSGQFEVIRTEHYIIDSVWKVPPGHFSTMQVDPLYCYEVKNQTICTKQKVRPGDTIYYQYLKKTKDTLE